MAVRLKLAAAVLGVLAAAGCGSPAPPSVPGRAPAPTSAANNALVCKHYLRQYSWKQNLTFPSAADAFKWEGYVAADSAEAAPGTKLAHDLNSELAAMQAALHGKKGAYKNGTVYHDCAGHA